MANKVGVFDSGIGGIYTLKALQEVYTGTAFIFLADQKHMPYGTKTNKQIVEYATKAMAFFVLQGCSIVIVACNTVSSIALAHIQEQFPELIIIGTIIPTVQQLINPQHVLVCATNATINNDAYKKQILSLWPSARIDNCAASILVPMIESNEYDEEAIKALFNPCQGDYDVVVLGCTHFPVMTSRIQSLYPSSLIVDSVQPLIDALEPYLNSLSKGLTRYYSTLKTSRFQLETELILGVDNVVIEDMTV